MKTLKWWQTAVFYQIYPRSFADGNGDGIGDFVGINAKLDYLQALGIEAIWLSPHFPSPLADGGYDISDYTGVAPEYGDLEDFKQFLAGAHARGIRVVLDLVLNHTSDQHPWFIESRSSCNNPKRDWYVWHDGKKDKDHGPPNNWYSIFGGSAWELDAATEQYYYHAFLKDQPDLNWRNPAMKQAMWDAVRFWLDLGVDGFRLDAIGTIFENPDLTDHQAQMTMDELRRAYRGTSSSPPDPAKQPLLMAQQALMFAEQMQQPGIHELMKELRTVLDEYSNPERVLIAEDENIAYHGNGHDELHLVFNFPLMATARLTPAWIRANQAERLGQLPPDAWPCNTLGNHDRPRVWSNFGDGNNDAALARLHAALMLTLRGTPVLFNGEELGMTDYYLPDASQLRDNWAIWLYESEVAEGTPPEVALLAASRFSRDRCRTPMHWVNTPNAGFSPEGVQPWLPVNPNYAEGVNVADQESDTGSMLHFYTRLLQLRKHTPALMVGDFAVLHDDAEDYLAFTRSTDQQACLIVLNFSAQPRTVAFDLAQRRVHCLFSTSQSELKSELKAAGLAYELSELKFSAFEIFIGELMDE